MFFATPGFLTPQVSESYTPQAQTYFDAVDTAGGTTSIIYKSAFNDLLISGTANGWLTGIVALKPGAGGTEAAAEINAINPGTLDTILINAPTIDPTIGVKFDGLAQYGNSQLIPNTHFDSAYQWAVGYYVITGSNTAGSSYSFGSGANDSNKRIMALDWNTTTNTTYLYANGLNTYRVQASNAASSGTLVGGVRSAINNLRIYHNGVNVGEYTVSQSASLPVNEFTEAARNAGSPGTPSPSVFSNAKFACFYYAKGWSIPQFESFQSDLQTFLTAIGI